MSEEITINTSSIKKGLSKSFKFISHKKVISIILIILFLTLLIGSSMMRIQNLPHLKDQTTDQYIPLALDPFYFLRIAETMVSEEGLTEFDPLRKPFQIEYIDEILPDAIVLFYKIGKAFDPNISIQLVGILSPVIFFILGLIVFFFLIVTLTNSKTTALISSAFLAMIPTYLYRTLAGFSDHEAIGMFAFFLVLLGYSVSMKYLDKINLKKYSLIKAIVFGLLVGFLSAFTLASWGGVATFIFMIIPLSFILFWLMNTQHKENLDKLSSLLTFYLVWFFSTMIFGLIYGFSLYSTFSRIALSTSSLLTGFVLLFLIVDYIIIKTRKKFLLLQKEKWKKYQIALSAGFAIILGIIVLSISGKNIFVFVPALFDQLLHPFGTARVGLTVAENLQPFLNDWIAQIGKIFFWLFYLGMVFVGIEMAKKVKQKKNKFLFGIIWIVMISGILFSRISSGSLFNGTNFISQLFYFGSLIIFVGYFMWLYLNKNLNIPVEILILFSWLFFTLIAGRGAIRLFFVITPFTCFMGGYAITKIVGYSKEVKDDFLKMILVLFTIFILIVSIISFVGFVKASNYQSKYTGPSANEQWQKAMSWVRENTPEDATFAHWWDYGYWVQYLGKRAVISDGGHFQGDYRDHLIGRYILTTPIPNTALSFMKSNNVSHLLIDSTDIGKYGAYSRIGSGPEGDDRYSGVPVMISAPELMQEKSNSILRVYQGNGNGVDQDIIYNLNGTEIFLPKNNAVIAGVIIESIDEGKNVVFSQPQGIFIYNQNQIYIPLRYLYVDGRFIDFGEGVESTAYLFPFVSQTDQGLKIDGVGSLFYLSPLVGKSLFAQLYLMNDPLDQYSSLNLVRTQHHPIITNLNLQGAAIKEFAFFNGVKGPIKIWEANYSDKILVKDEFLRKSGDYAEFDNLTFISN
jgi:asparagine N-glycosylation enzyme membrane subunit Stt3